MAYPYYPYIGYPWMPFDPLTAFYYWVGMMYYLYMFRIWMDIWSKFIEIIPTMFPTPKSPS